MNSVLCQDRSRRWGLHRGRAAGHGIREGLRVGPRGRAAKTNRYLLAAVEGASDLILVCDTRGTIEYANSAFERVTGHCADEVRGLPVDAVIRTPAGTPGHEQGPTNREAPSLWEGDVVEQRRDGEPYECHMAISPVLDADRAVIGYVYAGTDRSKERALESQLSWTARMAAVGQLAEGVAHDFNNMLTAIRGYAELIRVALPAGSDSAADIEEVILAADRAAELTRQLLLFARKTSLEPQTLDPAEIVEGIAPMLRRLLGEHIELTVSAAAGVGSIRANSAQLEQIVPNLAVNARDAMPDGGYLRIETANVLVDRGQVRGRPELAAGPHVLLAVSDTGTGMSQETVARIFEPLFTTKPVGQGTGMGLATVFGIVQLAGGWIEVDTEPGLGTSFRVYFPQAPDGREPAAEMGAHEKPAAGTETILLVEDDPAVRRYASRCLADLGYRVLEARTGEEALALVADDKPVDLVLSDVVMPGMQGLELRRRLREMRPGLRMLFVSGFARGSVLSSDDETDVAYLPKPFNRESLARAIRTLLDRDA